MSKAKGVAQTSIGRRLVMILAGAILTTRGKGKDKVTVDKCQHPEDKAFNEPRNDGSGKGDRICGVCGWTMCTVNMPAEDAVGQGAAPEIEETEGGGMEADVQAAEEALGLPAYVEGEETGNIVITPKEDLAGAAPAGSLYDQVQAGLSEGGASLDETTGEVVENSSASEGVDRSEDQAVAETVDESAADNAELVQDAKPDKVGKPFLKYLKVDVPDHRLAEMAKRQAELFTFWNSTKVSAKKAAKAYKEDIERTEDELTTIAEVIADGAEEVQISCRWEFDYRHGVKRLRRLDTNEIADIVTLTPEECHLSFDFEAEAEQETEQETEQIQEEPAGKAAEVTDEGGAVAEEPEPWTRNDERTLALLEQVGIKYSSVQALAPFSDEDLKAAEDWALAVYQQAGDFQDDGVPSMPDFLKGVEGTPVDAEYEEGPDIDPADRMNASGFYVGKDGKLHEGDSPDYSPDKETVLDADRRCCLPTDRNTAVIDEVETTYCTVCGLVSRKRAVNADVWDDDLDFEIGEKVDLAGLA